MDKDYQNNCLFITVKSESGPKVLKDELAGWDGCLKRECIDNLLASEGEGYSREDVIELTIPSVCVSLCDEALAGCSSIENVDFPQSLSYIGYRSFYNCSKLKSVGLLMGVSFINSQAFVGCHSLEFVALSNGVEVCHTIFNCKSLKGVILSDFTCNFQEHIGTGFYMSKDLEFIVCPKDRNEFIEKENLPKNCKVLYVEEKKEIISYFNEKSQNDAVWSQFESDDVLSRVSCMELGLLYEYIVTKNEACLSRLMDNSEFFSAPTQAVIAQLVESRISESADGVLGHLFTKANSAYQVKLPDKP